MTVCNPRILLALSVALALVGCKIEIFDLDLDDCDTDSQCDNGVYCDGEERCEPGILGRVCTVGDPPCDLDRLQVCAETPFSRCVSCTDEPSTPGCPPVPDAGVDAGPPPCGSTVCGAGEVCANLDATLVCLPACVLGLDRAHLGLGGGGRGCEVGDACYWTGDPDLLSTGYCAPGNYNDVMVPNVGVACGGDAECYSPFGRGRCEEGVCVVDDCLGLAELAPGVTLTAPLCPSPAVCGADQVCRAPCASAADCGETQACGGRPVQCRATCEADAECRPTEACLDGDGIACAEGAVCACTSAP